MKLLRVCALAMAIACSVQTAQAGNMQFGFNGTTPDIGTELLVLLSFWF